VDSPQGGDGGGMMDEIDLLRGHAKGINDDRVLSAMRDVIHEIKKLWMKSPDWYNTEEGAVLLIRLFELAEE
jgi:hypothetical protein